MQLQLNEISRNGFSKNFRRLKNIGLIQEGIIVQIKIILDGSDRNWIGISLRTAEAVDQDAHIHLAHLVFERKLLVFGRTLVILLVVLLAQVAIMLVEKSEEIVTVGRLMFLQMFDQNLKLNHIRKMKVQTLEQD